jgi:hypothetical protein
MKDNSTEILELSLSFLNRIGMQLTFSQLTEQLQQLSVADLSQLRYLLKKYWIEARRAEIYQHYLQAKSLESSQTFSSDLETLKSRLMK